MKSSVPMSYSSVNAQQLQATNSIAAEDYTVYVSAGLVYESNRGSTTYTKHYYAGPLRVASQIGSENPNYETHPVGGQIAPGGPVNTTPESYGEAVLSDLNTLLANYGMAVDANEPPQDTLSMQVINDPDECRMFYGDDLIEENRCLCDNFPDIAIQQGIDCNPYAPIYWYHPDYIGNIEFVTDRTGQPYQHFYYAAFGDPLVSQHVGTGSFNSTFRFNAKEFDEETGNYYYGARYYQPKSSIWMGVDAMATSYPGMNPYNFTMGNPIMAIDPDGDKPINPKFWKRGWNNYFNIKVIGIYEKSSSPFAYDSDLILAGDLIQSSTEQAKESPWASFGNNFASRPKDEFVSGDEFYDRKGNNNPIAAYKYDLASGPSKVSAGQSGNYDYRREILFSNSFEIVSVKDGVIYEIKLYKQNSEGKHQLSSTTCYETEFVKRGEEKFYNGSEIVIKTIFDVKVQEVITDHQTGEVHSSDYIHTGETQLNKIDLN
jgi:RHS repeat-associated protein